MTNAACLTCRHARKPKASGIGTALCVLSGAAVSVSDVCRSWVGLDGGFQSCSASTTATNSQKWEIQGVEQGVSDAL